MTATHRVGGQLLHARNELPRVLPHEPVATLDGHLRHFGARPRGETALIGEVERAGLRGHGGAGFPTATKMTAVASRRRRGIVVVNATEGEPMSSKDKALCTVAPHLILDGAILAAEAVDADQVVVCVDRAQASTIGSLRNAIYERTTYHAEPPIRLEALPTRYVAGAESALVHWLNGGEAKPTFVPPRPFERGVARRPTLVQNAETLAHLALIARFGADWFRGLGTHADPGSALVTVSGAVARPGVYEIPLGIPLRTILAAAGGAVEDCQAVLVGGYFGTWIAAEQAATITIDPTALRAVGAAFGCGVLVALPHHACGLAESAGVAQWLAGESAGQCGPCANGLPAIARALTAVAYGERTAENLTRLRRWLGEVQGRGACKLPDGAARFVASGLATFADDLERHASGRVCPAVTRTSYRWLATPPPGGWR
jgi:NADH:ubiquinone oxidoreductase subunit F (NADH-binding)